MTASADFRFTVPTMTPQDIEQRRQAAEYVEHAHSDWHRPHLLRFQALHEQAKAWLAAADDPLLSGELLWPNTRIGAVSGTRSLSSYSSFAGGGEVGGAIVRESILTGDLRHVRRGPEYEAGRCRLSDDAFWFTVARQIATEIVHEPEPGYDGYGPVMAGVCNFLGKHLDLPPVIKKGAKLAGVATCVGWPMNVRPPGYYLGAYIPNDPPEATTAGADPRSSGDPRPEKLIFPDRRDLRGIGRRLRLLYRFDDLRTLMTAALAPEHWIAASNIYDLIGDLRARPDRDVRLLARLLVDLGYLEDATELTAIPSRAESEAAVPDCFATLGIRFPFTSAKVKSAYRRKAKTAHPDAGGDHAAFVILRAAYEEALRIVTGVDDQRYAA